MKNPRVLILDDEPDFAKFVARVAAKLAYEVEITSHGYDFYAAVRRQEPRIIMLDIVMPDVDGIEVIQWLADRQTSARIIVMTGYDPRNKRVAELSERFKMSSPITTLQKPISIAGLTSALKNAAPSDLP